MKKGSEIGCTVEYVGQWKRLAVEEVGQWKMLDSDILDSERGWAMTGVENKQENKGEGEKKFHIRKPAKRNKCSTEREGADGAHKPPETSCPKSTPMHTDFNL